MPTPSIHPSQARTHVHMQAHSMPNKKNEMDFFEFLYANMVTEILQMMASHQSIYQIYQTFIFLTGHSFADTIFY